MSLFGTLAQNLHLANNSFDRHEQRITIAGMFDAYKRQQSMGTSLITAEHEAAAMDSQGIDVKFPVINYKNVSVRATKPVTITGIGENTSAFLTVTWVTIAAGFKMYTGQHRQNSIGYQRDMAAKIKAIDAAITTAVETQAVAATEAAKTQVLADEVNIIGGHGWTSNVVEETTSDLKDSQILHDLKPLMAANDFYDFGYDIVGNQGYRAILSRMQGFGQFNQEDRTLPFQGNFFHFTNGVANDTGKSATLYAIADGHLGFLSRVEPDALNRTDLSDGTKWEIYTLPTLGIPACLYTYEGRVDGSSPTGRADLTRTGEQVFDTAFQIGFVNAYNSDRTTIPSGIIKADITKTL